MTKPEATYCYRYPRPALTADCVLFRPAADGSGWATLLIRRAHAPYEGHWAFPGGFMEMDETIEACAARELQEETGLTGLALQQFGVFSAPGRDPRGRVVSVAFYAFAPAGQPEAVAGDDAADARWFALSALPLLAFDHAEMLRRACAAAFPHASPLAGRP